MVLCNSRYLVRRYNQQQNLLKRRQAERREEAEQEESQNAGGDAEAGEGAAAEVDPSTEKSTEEGQPEHQQSVSEAEPNQNPAQLHQPRQHPNLRYYSDSQPNNLWPKYQNLGEKVAKMWMLMPPEARQVIV